MTVRPTFLVTEMGDLPDVEVEWNNEHACVIISKADEEKGLGIAPDAVPLLIAALRQVCPPLDDETPAYPGKGPLWRTKNS